MKALIATTLAAGLLGGLVTTFVRPATAPPVSAADDGELERRMTAIEAQLEKIGARLADAPAGATTTAAPTRFSQDELQAAIDRGIELALRDHAAPVDAASSKGPVDEAETTVDIDVTLAALLDPLLSMGDAAELWDRLAKAGLIDDAIERLTEMAEEDPTNPEVHAQLGVAYIEKLKRVDSTIQQGMLAMTADKAFDTALDLDPEHWDARFTKAVSLSFWPPITGKQPEAVSNFQTLIAQQEKSGVTQPHYAQSYLLLGNLYLQQGKTDLAMQTYQQGLGLFPDHGDLKSQLESAK